MGSIFGKISEEEPKFQLKVETKEYEIRMYAPNIAIQTAMDSSQKKNSSSFMRLAGYIGVASVPKNTAKKRIAMTAPVVCVMPSKASDKEEMQFILPSKEVSPPAPSDGTGVSIVHRDGKLMAVRKFSGWPKECCFNSERDELLHFLSNDKVEILQPMYYETYTYNPPWTIPFCRTNEVAVQLAN